MFIHVPMQVCVTEIQTIEGRCDKDVSPVGGDHIKKTVHSSDPHLNIGHKLSVIQYVLE